MTTVQQAAADGLHVVMCLAFDHRAPADEVAAFKAALLDCNSVVSCCELTGTFNFMIEAVLPDLGAYKHKLEGIKVPLAKLVSRYDVHFVSERHVRVSKGEGERALWVPSLDGHKRVDFSSINKVTAEGDYMRLHTQGSTWLVHSTLADIMQHLGQADFVLIHRSTILRWGFIERLFHQDRVWTAKLDDGSTERISKSKVAKVLARLKTNSPRTKPSSAKTAHVDDRRAISQLKEAAPVTVT